MNEKHRMYNRTMKILITGVAGFIGFHLSKRLLDKGIIVIGIDNISDYYDVNLKYARIEILKKFDCFRFINNSITDKNVVNDLFQQENFDVVINFAAQAGVRYSITNPQTYIDTNIIGFYNILEAIRMVAEKENHAISHLLYASSSSVYGNQSKVPFSIDDNVDKPVSLYAVTKKSNELMAYTYSNLYGIPTTGLRFFTVYGPYGRPDMAYFTFTKNILSGKPINVFNNGDLYRDFTYINDIVTTVERIIYSPPSHSDIPARIYNVGNNKPESLVRFIEVLEESIGCVAKKNFLPMQKGDVYKTFADVSPLINDYDYKPSTTIEEGIPKFVEWYKEFYKVKL